MSSENVQSDIDSNTVLIPHPVTVPAADTVNAVDVVPSLDTPPRSASTEYHVTSGMDVSEVDDFDEKILESDTFQWKEVQPHSGSSDLSDTNGSEDYTDMPPLISDSEDSYESNTEEHEGRQEDAQEKEQDPVPTPPAHSVPPLIPILSFVLFILHLIYHAQLVYEKNEREKNPCFLLKW